MENLLLAALGGALGVAIAVGGVRLLISLAERYSPRASEIRLDAVVLGFALALSVAVALLLSFLASLPREGGVAAWILSGGHRLSGTLAKQRLQRGLVVVQVAVSVVLLAGAGLLTRTMMRLADVRTGLRTEQVLTMQVPLLTTSELLLDPGADAAAKERYDLMRREIAALPGVIAVGVGSPLPLRDSDVRFDVKAEGQSLAPGAAMPHAELRTVDPTFFNAAGIPLLAGRPFATTDGPSSGHVVIINRTLADRLFPDQDPIGKRIAWTGEVLRFTPLTGDWRTIVGVVANTQDGGLDAESRPVVFMPFAQFLAFSGGLVIRADSNVAALIPAATRIVQAPGAYRAHRAADDHRAVQGSERLAATAERRSHLVLRHPGVDHRGGGDRRRAGILGERAHHRDRHPHEPGSRPRPGTTNDPEGRRRAPGDRPGAGRRRRLLRRRHHPRAALRCRTARPADVHRRGGDDGGDRNRGLLDSGAASGADRPGDHHAVGLVGDPCVTALYLRPWG